MIYMIKRGVLGLPETVAQKVLKWTRNNRLHEVKKYFNLTGELPKISEST